MTPMTDRRRAPGMTAEERRDTIVRAALPLVAERGAAVTTAQIARAAGIGEATIFRVFADKNEVLQACIAAAMDPTLALRELRSISLDQPLVARLVEAVNALDAYFGRMGAVIGAVHASGTPHRRPGTEAVDPARPRGRSADRDAAQAATRQAVLELFQPDEAELRLPAEAATDAFLSMFFGRGGSRATTPATTEQLVDLFLHGAVQRV
ncbi:helix-turn-helix domain-containing protein [Actinoplanes sp. NPDC049548]|uniref:TetR/AcrR family transcriptional regulator n=1 Tax=Actinoplanes sp. NPDC049548 TaxID=3155152 RepID=UPI00343400E5